MRLLVRTMLAGVLVVSGCQTKGEKHAPCPPISGYAAADGLCGPARPVNDAFGSVLKE